MPLVCAATSCHVLGLPSLSSCHSGCCGLLLDLLPVRCFISPKLLAMGHVLGMLEVPGLGHCTDAASEAPVLWRRHGHGGCAGFIAWITGMPSEMAAERDGVLAFPGCCCPERQWGTQGSKAGEGTGVPAPGPCTGPSQADSAWGCALWGAHRELHRLNLGCACSHRSSCWCHNPAAEVWMQQKRAGLILAASTPCPLQPGIPYLLPACSPPAPCLLQPGDLQCYESDCSGFDSLL